MESEAVKQFFQALGSIIGRIWVDVTGWLRHESGRLSARKVAGFGILVLFTILSCQALGEAVPMNVKIGNIISLWPLLISGSALIGLTIGPLA